MTDLRPLFWMGRSDKDYAEFPIAARRWFGHSLRLVQTGEKEIEGAKPLVEGQLKELGIFELADSFDGDAYRVVYTLKLGDAVYVLHAFKKKSHRGISTAKHDVDLIRSRYQSAVSHYIRTFGRKPNR